MRLVDDAVVGGNFLVVLACNGELWSTTRPPSTSCARAHCLAFVPWARRGRIHKFDRYQQQRTLLVAKVAVTRWAAPGPGYMLPAY